MLIEVVFYYDKDLDNSNGKKFTNFIIIQNQEIILLLLR